jgi:DNA-binding response OmpR family regulator
MKRILIVEDDEDLRGLVERVFADEGFAVQTAGDGAEGIERLHAHRPDLLLLDLILPGLDGWAVLAHLRGMDGAPPVVVMSVRAEYEAIERAARADVAAYIEKPFSVRELLATCLAVIEGQAAVSPGVAADRRRAIRHLVRVPAEVVAHEGRWRAPGQVLDLSTGGARIAMGVPLPPSGDLRLDFALPGFGGRVSVDGHVRWRSPAEAGLAYGVSFVNLDPDDQARLDRMTSTRPH